MTDCRYYHDKNLYHINTPKDLEYRIEEAKRIYVRISHNYKRVYVPIGWICPFCYKIILDNDMPNLRGDYSKFKKKH